MTRKTIQKTNKVKRGGSKTRKQRRQIGSSSKASKYPPGMSECEKNGYVKKYQAAVKDSKAICKKFHSGNKGISDCEKMMEKYNLFPSIKSEK